MGVREDTLRMLREGLSPKEISRARGVSIDTTLGYLDQLVGRGDLRRSDIFFSVPKDIRNIIPISLFSGDTRTIQGISALARMFSINADPEDILVVIRYGDSRHALGDMYEDIRAIETYLHGVIGQALLDEYEGSEMGWWRQGVPESVRKSCVIRQEEDSEPVLDPYCYTELLDLWQILDKQWKVLSKVLPEEMTKNKQDLRRKMIRLNTIRRNVMHPVRGIIPSEEDFDFIREFKEQLLIRSD
jgi:hypothetical protein